jgi:hypothetical protein
MMSTENETAMPKPFFWDYDKHRRLFQNPGFFREVLPEGAVDLLLKETQGRFLPVAEVQPQKVKTRQEEEAIGLGKQECSFCKDSERTRRLYKGKETGVEVLWPVRCYCIVYRKYFSRWSNTRYVDKDRQDCTMENLLSGKLRSRFGRLTDQAYETMLAAVQQFPFYNCLLVGPAGCGKTTLLTALYDQALRAWAERSYERGLYDPAVWKTTAWQLSQENIAWANRPSDDSGPAVPRPTVTYEALMTALKPESGFTPHISMDEFDKYKKSSADFHNPIFHQLINECQSNGGQFVCASNIDIEWLMRDLGPQFGEPMIRRLVGSPRGMYLNFWWGGKVYINNVRHQLVNGKLMPVENDLIDAEFAKGQVSDGPQEELTTEDPPPSRSAETRKGGAVNNGGAMPKGASAKTTTVKFTGLPMRRKSNTKAVEPE